MARSRHVPPPAEATPEDREKLWKRLADLRIVGFAHVAEQVSR